MLILLYLCVYLHIYIYMYIYIYVYYVYIIILCVYNMYIYNMHIYIVMQLCRARTFFICKLLVRQGDTLIWSSMAWTALSQPPRSSRPRNATATTDLVVTWFQKIRWRDGILSYACWAMAAISSSWGYPLVNVYITMENHHFQWVNPLFLWSFSIAKLNYRRILITLMM